MSLEKVLFLMKLIKDDDFFSSNIVDFEVNEKNESVLISKDIDSYRNKVEYIKYVVSVNNSQVNIVKNKEDESFAFYGLKFVSIAGVNLVEVYFNYRKIYIYELSNNFLTCDDMDSMEILAQRGIDNSGRIIGRKK